MTSAPDGVEAQIAAFAAKILAPYQQRLERASEPPQGRVINDAVWGSIRLEPWEVAIVDSPLMQRLRSLRQLGVVHWVYPSAGHSRFEHSIGTMHCMASVIDGLERTSGKLGSPLVDDATRSLLRVAALVHDCGHTVMSHVGERVAKKLPGMEAFIDQVAEEYELGDRPSVSEAIAVAFVRSKAFQDLLASPRVGADFVHDPRKAADQIARMLTGAPALDGQSFLTLLVSGAFDADKLDYMVRDCQMAGIPCAVDVSRVISKLHCIDIPPDVSPKLFKEYRVWAKLNDNASLRVLALPRSALTVLNELAVTRATLFEKVYYHPKVRALEAVAQRLLRGLNVSTISQWLELTDEQVIQAPSFSRLRDRDLPKRAFNIAAPPPAQGGPWRKFGLRIADQQFEKAVLRGAQEAAAILDGGTVTEVIVDMPDFSRAEMDAGAFVGDSAIDVARSQASQAGGRSEAGKTLARERVYVFAAQEATLPTFFAAWREARALGLDVGDVTSLQWKQDPDTLREAGNKLISKGYFGDNNPDLELAHLPSREERSVEDFLRSARARLDRLASTLGAYQALDGRRIDAAAVAQFLRQFATRERARAALRLLEQIEFIDRPQLADALASVLKKLREEGETIAFVCPLGGLADSSAHIAYLMLDLKEEERAEVVPLSEALVRCEKGVVGRIVLWDDFCGKGGHTLTVLAQWLGRPGEAPLKERHVEALAEPGALQRAKPIIAFARARPAGIDELTQKLPALGMEGILIRDGGRVPDRNPLLFTPSAVFPHDQERDNLRDFLAEKGAQLLEANKPDWADGKHEANALGYGAAGHLLVFPHNVPTVTLTALWEDGRRWRALLPRRRK